MNATNTNQLPSAPALLSPAGWTFFLAAVVLLCGLVPIFNIWLPVDSFFHVSDYAVALVGKIMCYAICALATDLIWSYTGMLSLGHGFAY